MKYVSLFSGIEAATVAWEPLGWEPVCFAEFDEFPSAVLAERYPEVPNIGDVTKMNWKKYRNKVDLVVGGSPCQSFSIAGKREGLQGESGLMFEYIRAVREIRPRWFLWENVPGALSSENGEAFRQLLSEMDKLGYGLAWRVLDAQFFGVAQRRRRLFLVGRLGACPPVEVLIEPESMRGDFESSAEKRASLAEEAGRSPRSAGFKYHQGAGAGGVGAEPEQSPTLTADWHNPAVYPIDEPITMADLNANTAIGYDMVGTLKVGGDAPWNQVDEPACGDCAHCIEGCCDYGICELEFEEAFSAQEAKEPMAAWEAAKWARDWIVEHYKDMQEDWCKRFDG